MSGRPKIMLLGSPLLGPAVWGPVHDRLRAAGRESCILVAQSAASGESSRVLDDFRAAIPAAEDIILVAHSNAGAYLPQLALEIDAIAMVFIDAVLPASVGSTPLTRVSALPWLATLADEHGVLPAWTQWWPDADVAALFPDDQTRLLVAAEQPRIPFAYFRQSVDAPAGWDDRPASYLAYGDNYAAERLDAQNRGWPTRTLDGGHLHMLVDPDAVAAIMLDLIGPG
ncbi:MAG TPA: alpha/beta hydrolase [Galbitalea sp.]|jgi:hypothetical protein|nr:alpha/beta hydrolase [Galbitalea sp.]